MLLEAQQRLAATEVDAGPLTPVRNGTQRGYLVVLGQMLTGDRPIGKDCRSVCAAYLAKHPSAGCYIQLVAHPDTDEPFHCLLTDHTGRAVADAYNGKVINKGRGPLYVFTTGAGEKVEAPVVEIVATKEFMQHLTHGTFDAWVKQFPN